MTIRSAIQSGVSALQAAGVPDPQTDAGILLSHVLGIPRMELLLHGLQALTEEQEQRFSSLLLSRASRKPLQYLLGDQGFYGLLFSVNEHVLIPRPETETLCEHALLYLRTLPAPRVLDLCTGSGAIAVTIKHECPAAQVIATDIDASALAVAKKNAKRNEADISWAQGDLFEPITGERFHCIVCNPPYIENAACKALQPEVLQEPMLALTGGEDGLDFYRRIAYEAPLHLYPNGLLCLEIGDQQAKAVCALLAEENRFQNISMHCDLSGSPRVVCAYALCSPT